MTFRLEFYTQDDIERILRRSAKILGVSADDEAISLIAASSRFTPRVANRLLKRIRDYAAVKSDGKITRTVTEKSLRLMEVDERGLEEMDRAILKTLAEKFSGGPVGLKTLAAAVSEEEETLEDIYEPYLMQLGLLARTAKGRVLTPAAYEHLGLPPPASQQTLLR